MENSVRGVIYNVYDGCPVEEIRAGFLKKNEGMEILDGRPLGKFKAIQITFGGKRVPWQVTYWNCLYAVIPYRELVETCYNCRRVGNRANVCYRPQTNLCHRFGKDHPAPPEGKSLTCTPDGIPPGRQQSSEDKSQDGKEEQRSRPTEWSSSGARDSRDRSASFPPRAGGGKAGGRGSSHERSANDTTKKAPHKVAQAAGSRVQESTAMEVENRGPVERPPPADEGTNAETVAETLTADTPQPAFKVTSVKSLLSLRQSMETG
ncbi:hypothetical protein HPB49_010658 [Dermacentor silvarum]|uniref:Uncharacterized protein n=1 Tax=Dermacentor silvarum TaxID=543639 RepID=A0ACB8D4X1_DERSI|nr:hypothetical protein HPB49_010658 [Dermacentor silvarum]